MHAIRSGERMERHTALARGVVQMVEAADRSLQLGGVEVPLDRGLSVDELGSPSQAASDSSAVEATSLGRGLHPGAPAEAAGSVLGPA